MKTKELLDKYQKILGGLLKTKPEDIRFLIGKNEIKELEYFQPEKDSEGNETGNQIRHTTWQNWSEGVYSVYLKEQKISSFELYKMPHCCAILVSCKALVQPAFRHKRVGTTLNTMRQDIGRILGYSTLMCTDISQNTHQRQLLATNGWKDIYEVKNKRTGNTVFISVINL
jgi:hypothetical protein